MVRNNTCGQLLPRQSGDPLMMHCPVGLGQNSLQKLEIYSSFFLSDVGICCCMHNYSVARQTNEQWSKQNSLCDCQRAIVLFFVNFHGVHRWG